MLVARMASCSGANALSTKLAEIQPEKRQNVQKTRFLQKAPRSMG